MHNEEFFHQHDDALELERRAIAQVILGQDTLELLTVGIDIGTSTSLLLFARVFFERQERHRSHRFAVVDRRIEWRSPIMLTPFLSDGQIDAHKLSHFIRDCYTQAGYTRDDVDSGAVILTGEATKRSNARAIDEIFASESGKFVCATAGHRLEGILAAHGSGATALSRERNARSLHVDIGGGTTKLALIDHGEIRSIAAFAVGGRLLATDDDGLWTRVGASAEMVARELGFGASPSQLADRTTRRRITRRLAQLVVDQILTGPTDDLGRSLQLTDPLQRDLQPEFITFSGGVAEHAFGHESRDFGDIGKDLADDLIDELGARLSIPAIDAGQRIRATVIGASQFTVQVSGKTIFLTEQQKLPVHNVPVVELGESLPEGDIDPESVAVAFRRNADRHDIDLRQPVCLTLRWTGSASYRRLAAVARAVTATAAPTPGTDHVVIVVIDADLGQSLGRAIRSAGLQRSLVSLDGIELQEFDFIDIGELRDPPGVVPVVVKSLLF